MFSELQLNASRLQRSLTKATEKNKRWIIPFLCQPSMELLYNICVRVALVNQHDKQILSRVPLAYRLTCTIYDIVDQSLGLRKVHHVVKLLMLTRNFAFFFFQNIQSDPAEKHRGGVHHQVRASLSRLLYIFRMVAESIIM